MDTQRWHKTQAAHNQKFSNDISAILPNQYRDWEIISMFYAALHLVDKYFSNNDVPMPTGHRSRELKIQSVLPAIYDDYMDLFRLSMDSRYRIQYANITSSDVDVAQTRLNDIVNYFMKLDGSEH